MLLARKIRHARTRTACAVVVACVLTSVAAARQTPADSAKPAAKSEKKSTAHITSVKRTRKKKSARARGQQKIDSERAHAIQAALIREHYLTGEPSGTWNQTSEEAMRRYQGDHGWQTKEVPDSRALISLGLGPSHDHLLNPESAMTGPAEPKETSSAAASHGADPALTNKNAGTPADARPVTTPAQDTPHPQ